MHRVARPNLVQLALALAAGATPLAATAQDTPGPVLPPPSLYDDAPPSAQSAPVTTAPRVEPAPAPAAPAATAPAAAAPAPMPSAAPAPMPSAAPAPAAAAPSTTQPAERPWYERTWDSITGWFGGDSDAGAQPQPSKATAAAAAPAAGAKKPGIGTRGRYLYCEPYGRSSTSQLVTCPSAPPAQPEAVAAVPPPAQPIPQPVEVTPLPALQLKEERALEPEPPAAPAPVAPQPPLAAEPAPPPPPPVEVHTLSADALFSFGSYELKPSARAALDDLVARLKEVTYRQIKVTGHTDPIGSAAHNNRLSLQRAQAVKRYLTEHGVVADRIDAEGLGSSMPMVIERDCAKLPRQQKIACYQPDRRVEIEVTGAVEKLAGQ
jgi:outer membrane protein OmpA-like peptidoglycan-associated protein